MANTFYSEVFLGLSSQHTNATPSQQLNVFTIQLLEQTSVNIHVTKSISSAIVDVVLQNCGSLAGEQAANLGEEGEA